MKVSPELLEHLEALLTPRRRELFRKVQIPMVGFTESLNISVSAAIILQNLSSRLRRSGVDWQFSEDEKLLKRLQWTRECIKSADEVINRFQTSL